MLDIAFPAEFDPDFYRLRHDDLASLDEVEAARHYQEFGKREGRICSPGEVRERFVRLLQGAPALEIGPFYKPVLRGPEARYFDVMDADGLRARAAGIPGGRPEDVPHTIHFTSPVGDLGAVDRRFPLAVSSHSIEHQPDLIAHLQGVARILEPEGLYALLIPDYRFTFDHFLPPTTVQDVLQAKGRRLHSLEAVLQHLTLTTHNEPARHWRGDHEYPGDVSREAIAHAIALARRDEYCDVHAWVFCPDNFRSVIHELHERAETPLAVHRVYATPFGRGEFMAVLRRDH